MTVLKLNLLQTYHIHSSVSVMVSQEFHKHNVCSYLLLLMVILSCWHCTQVIGLLDVQRVIYIKHLW